MMKDMLNVNAGTIKQGRSNLVFYTFANRVTEEQSLLYFFGYCVFLIVLTDKIIHSDNYILSFQCLFSAAISQIGKHFLIRKLAFSILVSRISTLMPPMTLR